MCTNSRSCTSSCRPKVKVRGQEPRTHYTPAICDFVDCTWVTLVYLFICLISLSQYSSGRISAVRATQRPYRTILATRESRVARTVLSADRVSHSVDRPRAFLHVLRATGSAQIRQSPEQSIPVMHALESELNLIIRKCPGWIRSESVRIPVNRIPVNTYRMERYM